MPHTENNRSRIEHEQLIKTKQWCSLKKKSWYFEFLLAMGRARSLTIAPLYFLCLQFCLQFIGDEYDVQIEPCQKHV